MSLTMTCPRRVEGPWYDRRNEDDWREDDNTCSYCGSMNPVDFFKRIKEGAVLSPTDKNYKVYVKGKPTLDKVGKFYFRHLSYKQRLEFIELYNSKAMKIAGYNHEEGEHEHGDFYVLPFFVRRTTSNGAGEAI